jgi:hydroxymethylbilane synthase
MSRPFILGTRASALALAQTELTRAALLRAFPAMPLEVKTFVTRGDQKLDLSLIRSNEAGGKGLFTKELEDALLAGAIDVAVHSMKDLPGHNPFGLEITGVLERAATADLLVSKTADRFEALPMGARIGTSSVRRARQLRWQRPDLVVEEFRGNVQTRLRKLGQSPVLAAIVLAQAGLDRLGFDTGSSDLVFEEYSFRLGSLANHMFPAIGQGAIALQTRADREDVKQVIDAISHPPTFVAVRAERELQRLLSGDCTLPVGVQTSITGEVLKLSVRLFPGEAFEPICVETEGSIERPERLAAEAFKKLGV